MTQIERTNEMINQLQRKINLLKLNVKFIPEDDKPKLRSDILRWEVHLCTLIKNREDLRRDDKIFELDLIEGKLGLK